MPNQVEVFVLGRVILNKVRHFKVSLLSFKNEIDLTEVISLIYGYVNHISTQWKYEPTIPFGYEVNFNNLIRLLVDILIHGNVNLLE